MMSKRLTIISLDGHAQMPESAWEKYLDKEFHQYLPKLSEENSVMTKLMGMHVTRTHSGDDLEVFDTEGAYRGGGANGWYDPEVRLAEMDREGIAAEFAFDGDPRMLGMFFQSANTPYAKDLCNAGVRAYHRWLHDAFGHAKDRLIPVGIIGHTPWASMKDMLAELDWIADRGFLATSMPGFVTYPGEPELFDPYWDPFWARCEERGIALWVHAGHGDKQGDTGVAMMRVGKQLKPDASNYQELHDLFIAPLFDGAGVFEAMKPRRSMWQLMMGGVFDRFPKLKLVLNEIYIDWMPGTLRCLDEEFKKRRGELPAKRLPSEYWRTNGVTSMSFPRKAEVEMRHEVGIDTVTFGRDYPHPEGTWPNTKHWLRDLFKGVPENEVRAILGENAIRALNLDGAKYDAIAARVGPTVEEILGPGPDVDPKLIAHFDKRGHYLQPAEGEQRFEEIRDQFREDAWQAAGFMPA
jgi:predicted TIM-barrel fold metal-dependent hydrolase